MPWKEFGHGYALAVCGRICMHRKRINASTVLAGQRLGIKEVDEGVWIVSFMSYDLGRTKLLIGGGPSLTKPVSGGANPCLQGKTQGILQF